MRKLVFAAIFIASSLANASVLATDMSQLPDFGPKEALTIVSGEKEYAFTVEVADTPAEHSRGLMYRDVIALNEGMLFEFPRPKVASIWMKNTSVFLDILFVRPDGRILKIEHSAKPYSLRSMTSEAPVAAVLELAGGQAKALGIRPGDMIVHDFFAP